MIVSTEARTTWGLRLRRSFLVTTLALVEDFGRTKEDFLEKILRERDRKRENKYENETRVILEKGIDLLGRSWTTTTSSLWRALRSVCHNRETMQ